MIFNISVLDLYTCYLTFLMCKIPLTWVNSSCIADKLAMQSYNVMAFKILLTY